MDVPDEVLIWYNSMKDPNIMIKRTMVKFNNPLTKKNNGTAQEIYFVLYPLNGPQYNIYCDGTLYCYCP